MLTGGILSRTAQLCGVGPLKFHLPLTVDVVRVTTIQLTNWLTQTDTRQYNWDLGSKRIWFLTHNVISYWFLLRHIWKLSRVWEPSLIYYCGGPLQSWAVLNLSTKCDDPDVTQTKKKITTDVKLNNEMLCQIWFQCPSFSSYHLIVVFIFCCMTVKSHFMWICSEIQYTFWFWFNSLRCRRGFQVHWNKTLPQWLPHSQPHSSSSSSTIQWVSPCSCLSWTEAVLEWVPTRHVNDSTYSKLLQYGFLKNLIWFYSVWNSKSSMLEVCIYTMHVLKCLNFLFFAK